MRTLLTEVLRRLPIDQHRRHALRALQGRLKRWVGLSSALPGQLPDAIELVVPTPGGIDFVFFGIVDWHFRFQRPQQLAVQLARHGHRVLYVSSNFIDDSGGGFRVEQLNDAYPLYQIYLHLRGAPGIYWQRPGGDSVEQLRCSLGMAIGWSGWRDPVLVLGHPFWSVLHGWTDCAALVYDRMDFHEGFGAHSHQLVEAERALMRCADLTVCSSLWLQQDASRDARRLALIRNAADFNHFAARPSKCYEDPEGRRIIGYYGAIAPWLDLDIVTGIAERFRECLVLLIGGDQIGAGRRLRRYRNITLLDEVPYNALPGYLHAFDVCILPRVVSTLTGAMNPVKLYEYLSAGRPVVATNLPEIKEMKGLAGLVYASDGRAAFLDAVASALAEEPEDPRVEARRRFAAEQTWALRAEALEREVRQVIKANDPTRRPIAESD